jgi:hypothetical protein
MGMWPNPFLLLWVWTGRLKQPRITGFRHACGWVSLASATIGLTIFFIGVGVAPDQGSAAYEVWYSAWLRDCLIVSAGTFLTGLTGLGKRQWVVLLSSLITPVACLLTKVLE